MISIPDQSPQWCSATAHAMRACCLVAAWQIAPSTVKGIDGEPHLFTVQGMSTYAVCERPLDPVPDGLTLIGVQWQHWIYSVNSANSVN